MKKISGIFIFIAFLFYLTNSIGGIINYELMSSFIPSWVWSVLNVMSNLGFVILGFYLLTSEDEN